MKVAVVIVTYNRIKLLKECVSMVYSQSESFCKVCIVNNCSTDGTKEYLDSLNYSNLIIYNSGDNLGGAWGFYKGLKLLKDTIYNYVLMIDDDAILEANFLSELKKGMKQYPKYKSYSCVVKLIDSTIDLGHRMNITNELTAKMTPCKLELYKDKVFECDTASFCGLSVSKEVVSKIGLPEKKYFIWFDDVEYSLRIRNHTKILNINDAIIIHKTNDSFSNKNVSWKTYYGMRNYISLIKKHFGLIALICVFVKYIVKIVVSFVLRKKIGGIMVYELFFDSLADGIRGRLGRNERYLPKKQ